MNAADEEARAVLAQIDSVLDRTKRQGRQATRGEKKYLLDLKIQLVVLRRQGAKV